MHLRLMIPYRYKINPFTYFLSSLSSSRDLPRHPRHCKGDMVLYESHSLIHGRPFPMKGRFFANIFIHFEPVVKQKSSEDNESELPVYILPGSPSAQEWIARRPQGYEVSKIAWYYLLGVSSYFIPRFLTLNFPALFIHLS